MSTALRALVLACGLTLAPACAGDDEGSCEGSASTGASSTSAGESTTTGGGDSPVYGPCDEICSLDLERSCIKPGDGAPLEFCTDACAAAGECPKAPGGTATPICIDPGAGSICALECAGAECPSGMTCKLVATAEGAKSLCFSSSP
ncbi:MAG: hypothetical protein R3B09_10930 [Nannocystaceae bacterium]